jgi:hypothetical protein
MAPMVVQRVRANLLVSGLLMVLLTVTGCGGEDKPAICSDVDALKSSVSALTDIELDQGALSELQKVKSEAQAEFSTEIDAVDTATTAVKDSLDAAVASPSAPTIAAVGVALSQLKTALANLQSAVESTC